MTRTEELANLLMRGIRRELKRLRAVDPHALGREDWQLRAAVTDAKAGIVVADFPGLLERALSRTELRACQRAAQRLEVLGKLRRLKLGYDGARTTHLQLT